MVKKLAIVTIVGGILLTASTTSQAQQTPPPQQAQSQTVAPPPAAAPPASPTATPAPINLNAATVAELEKLPGVGPAVAARIIEYRTKNGAFKKIEDLMNIRGIGEKTFLRLKPLVTIVPPKTTER